MLCLHTFVIGIGFYGIYVGIGLSEVLEVSSWYAFLLGGPPILIAGVVYPAFYLYALRGVLKRLPTDMQRKPEPNKSGEGTARSRAE